MANGLFGGGTGTLADPFLVEDADDLNAIRNQSEDDYAYKQTANIDLSVAPYNDGWTPLPFFKGTYDGQKYTISNLYSTIGGLFSAMSQVAYVDELGNIRNIILLNLVINTTNNSVGGIVGTYNTTGSAVRLFGCHVQGTITGGSYVGGLVGTGVTSAYSPNLPTWEHCSADVTINGADYLGGLIGALLFHTNTVATGYARVANCYTKGTLNGTGSFIGGICGYLGAGPSNSNIRTYYYIENNYSSMTLKGLDHVGGITGFVSRNASGYLYGYIRQCVSLMPSITRISGAETTFGRVWGIAHLNYMQLADNYALDTMEFLTL